MPFPEWAESQKKQGFEIKKIGNGYYMYERKSRWDKKKKKSVKVTGTYIGVFTPDGISPSKKRLDETKPVFSQKYGETAFVKFIANDILEILSKHLGEITAHKIWAVVISSKVGTIFILFRHLVKYAISDCAKEW